MDKFEAKRTLLERVVTFNNTKPNRFAEILAKRDNTNSPSNKRIEHFIETHNLTDKYPVRDLYRWHMLLTSSCYRGRKELLKNLGVNLETDMATIPEFFEVVKGKYGTEIIEFVEDIMTRMQEKENLHQVDDRPAED